MKLEGVERWGGWNWVELRRRAGGEYDQNNCMEFSKKQSNIFKDITED